MLLCEDGRRTNRCWTYYASQLHREENGTVWKIYRTRSYEQSLILGPVTEDQWTLNSTYYRYRVSDRQSDRCMEGMPMVPLLASLNDRIVGYIGRKVAEGIEVDVYKTRGLSRNDAVEYFRVEVDSGAPFDILSEEGDRVVLFGDFKLIDKEQPFYKTGCDLN